VLYAVLADRVLEVVAAALCKSWIHVIRFNIPQHDSYTGAGHGS